MNFKKSFMVVLTAASLIATARAGNNLSVKLDVEGDSLQTTTRLTEVFQSELGKIPDVALVNQGHWDLDVSRSGPLSGQWIGGLLNQHRGPRAVANGNP